MIIWFINSIFRLLTSAQTKWSSICIQLLLFPSNRNNVYTHSFPMSLAFVEPSCFKSIKTQPKVAFCILYWKHQPCISGRPEESHRFNSGNRLWKIFLMRSVREYPSWSNKTLDNLFSYFSPWSFTFYLNKWRIKILKIIHS